MGSVLIPSLPIVWLTCKAIPVALYAAFFRIAMTCILICIPVIVAFYEGLAVPSTCLIEVLEVKRVDQIEVKSVSRDGSEVRRSPP
jgi:hypothetical protein